MYIIVHTIIKLVHLSIFKQFQFNFKFAINMKQNNDETLESPAKKKLSQIYFGVKTEDFK
jgi:hypothetical protein